MNINKQQGLYKTTVLIAVWQHPQRYLIFILNPHVSKMSHIFVLLSSDSRSTSNVSAFIRVFWILSSYGLSIDIPDDTGYTVVQMPEGTVKIQILAQT